MRRLSTCRADENDIDHCLCVLKDFGRSPGTPVFDIARLCGDALDGRGRVGTDPELLRTAGDIYVVFSLHPRACTILISLLGILDVEELLTLLVLPISDIRPA
jgi:hypothetical protein